MRKKDALVLLVGSMLVAMTTPVMALEGPAESLPLGVDIVDSDLGGPDDKEQWGREGGRTFTFTIFQVDEYAQLKWQPIEVGIAFDGAIDEEGEILTFDSMGVGSAVWIGNTTVEVLDEDTGTYETVEVNTEFILTVKDSYDLPVSFETMNGLPTVDIKALTLPALFTATLEMRAKVPPYDSVTEICPYAAPTVGEYLPALDVFDCLQTNPAEDRPVISMFEYGFFYELDDPNLLSLDLAEHDAHMEELVGGVQTSVDDIYMWTNFLFTDWPLRISGINDAHAQINDNLAIMGSTLDEINMLVENSCTQSDQQQVLDELNDIEEDLTPMFDYHLLMFGLGPFMQDQELAQYVPAVIDNSPLYQKLDAMNETCTQMSTQMQQYADIIESLTTQLETANQQIVDLTVEMGSMYTEEELEQIIIDACPGLSEDAGDGTPE